MPQSIYNTLPDNTTLPMFARMQQMGGQFIGSMLGMEGQTIPYVGPNQSVFEAMYASQVTNKQWQLTQQAVVESFARGLSNAVGRVGANLGVPGMLGVSDSDFSGAMSNGGNTDAGRFLAGLMLNSGVANNIMGGDLMGSYQHMFANRQLFGASALAPINAMDPRQQETTRQIAFDVTTAVQQAIRGDANGNLGLLPNLKFTRGFQDQDIFRMLTAATEGGSLGDFGSLMNDARMADAARITSDKSFRESGGAYAHLSDSEFADVVNGVSSGTKVLAGGRYEKVLDDTKKFTEQITATFSALGDMVGSRDMTQLNGVLDKLTSGTWRNNMAEVGGQLESTFRAVTAFGHSVGRSSSEMLGTMSRVQDGVLGAFGITQGNLAAGFGANIMGAQTQAEMTMRIHGIANRTGRRSSFDIERITNQEVNAAVSGMNSSGGQALNMLAYMHQTGMIDKATYEDLGARMSSGDSGARVMARDEIFQMFSGDVGLARQYLANPENRRMLNESIDDAHRASNQAIIYAGQSMDINKAVSRGQQRGWDSSGGALLRMSGLDPGGNVVADADAEASKTAVVAMMRSKGHAGADVLEKVYADARASGKSASEAYSRMRGVMSGDITMKQHMGDVADVEKLARATNRSNRLGAEAFSNPDDVKAYVEFIGEGGGLDMNLIGQAKSMAGVGAAVQEGLKSAMQLGVLDEKSIADIRETAKTNPGVAFKQLQNALGSADPVLAGGVRRAMRKGGRDAAALAGKEAKDRVTREGGAADPASLLANKSKALQSLGISVEDHNLINDRLAMSPDEYARYMGVGKEGGAQLSAIELQTVNTRAKGSQAIASYLMGDTSLARVLGITGTGEGGAITKEDVDNLDQDKLRSVVASMDVAARDEELKLDDEDYRKSVKAAEVEAERAKLIDEIGPRGFGRVTAKGIDHAVTSLWHGDSTRRDLETLTGQSFDRSVRSDGPAKLALAEVAAKYTSAESMSALSPEQLKAAKRLIKNTGGDAKSEKEKAEDKQRDKEKSDDEKKSKDGKGKGTITGTLTLIDPRTRKRVTAELNAIRD